MRTVEHQSPDLDKLGITNNIRVLNVEYADDGKGCKVVMQGKNQNGRPATFETGSFFDNGGDIEVEPKHDICVSTAGGCTRNCDFCAVPKAALGFERLLTTDEIVEQIRYAIDLRNPKAVVPNVVGLMGNGEPPDNVRAIIPALQTVIADSTRPINRVTISTIGENAKGIIALADAFAESPVPVKLQFSLHVADDEKRRRIIPGKRSVADIMSDVDYFAERTGHAVKFNIVLMETADGFTNATKEDALALVKYLRSPSFYSGRPLQRRLKLSAYNPIPGFPYKSPEKHVRDSFVTTLLDLGIDKIKTFKGSGIDITGGKGGFACGQLRATTHILLDSIQSA